MANSETAFESTWSTGEIKHGEQFSYWNDAICDAIMKLELERTQSGTFQAELVARQAGDIGFNCVRSDGHVARLTQSGISKLSDYHFYFLIQKNGKLPSSQHGVKNQLLPGDAIIIDGLYPFELSFPDAFECISIKIPRTLLASKLTDTDALSNSKVARGSHLSQAIFHYIHFILNSPDSSYSVDITTETLLNLVASSSSSRESKELTTRPTRTIQKYRDIERYIDEHFYDELTPVSVARQFNISVNYLHKIFAQNGVTLGECVQKTRLTHAHKLITASDTKDLPVSDIAYQSGFKDLSHFYKAFKGRFGMPPGRYRKIAQ